MHGRRVVLAAEAKWTTKPLGAGVLTSLLDHKLPAMAQAGFDVDDCAVVLVSRSGFTDGVRRLAADHPGVRLVDAIELLGELSEKR